jgi:hypothetical protein
MPRNTPPPCAEGNSAPRNARVAFSSCEPPGDRRQNERQGDDLQEVDCVTDTAESGLVVHYAALRFRVGTVVRFAVLALR